MARLIELIPDADTLLGLAPEELAFYVLRAAGDSRQASQMCIRQAMVEDLRTRPGIGNGYRDQRVLKSRLLLAKRGRGLRTSFTLCPPPE